MDKTEYINKPHALNDESNYETVNKNPVPKVEAECKRMFKNVSREKLPENTIKELTPNHSRTPVFMAFQKTIRRGFHSDLLFQLVGAPLKIYHAC